MAGTSSAMAARMSAIQTPAMTDKVLTPIEIGLTAAIVSVDGNEPSILTASGADGGELEGLPFGPFDALAHRTMEIGLRHGWRGDRPAPRLCRTALYIRRPRPRATRRHGRPCRLSVTRADARRTTPSKPQVAGATAVVPLFSVGGLRDAPPPMIAKEILPALETWRRKSEKAGRCARAAARRSCAALLEHTAHSGMKNACWTATNCSMKPG